MREVARQHSISFKDMRFVRRLERSEQNDLLHCHLLVWTGGPWTLTDAFRAASLWNCEDNGTKHVTPYDDRQAGSDYVLKGLGYTEAVKAGFQYELTKSERVGLSGSGCLMIDHNTVTAIQAAANRGAALQGRQMSVKVR